MGTQWLKHLVSKNIGRNVGNFSLSTMATYLVNGQVEKWRAKVVEDTYQNTMKVRFVYVVKDKTTALSSVEVADIKKHFDDCVILNICESSTINYVNYVGLVILVAKLDTYICERSNEFAFM